MVMVIYISVTYDYVFVMSRRGLIEKLVHFHFNLL
jgi:hypothetical protein